MKKIVFVVVSISLLLSACQPKSAGPQISVSDAWGRSSPTVAASGAFYMTIKNAGSEADTLVGVKSPACGLAELHESRMGDNGTMSMHPIEGGVEVPARSSVDLKPGGIHVMCMDKQVDFKVGDTYPVTLTFEKAGDVNVEVEIKDMP